MAVNFNKVTRGYAVTLAPAGKFPIVGDRIFATLAEAQAYVDKANGTAIPGISLSVIADGNNNGVYWVAQAAGYDGATVGILQKMGEGGGTPSGGQVTYDSIISALGYTPFDSDAFTKANIKNALGIKDWALASSKPSYTWSEIGSRPTALSAFTNDLGLGSLAYKSSLVASDIPSLPWSKITSGKPTTLSGYGITDAILYEKAIDLSSAYHSMGYGHASKGWKASGPAVVFGDTSYNLAMQCAIANADYVSLYLRMRYNGEDKGWDRVVTEGLLSRGAIAFDSTAYKSYGDYVLHRNADDGDTYLNYGVASNDKAGLRVFGNNIYFYAGEASAYNTYLGLYAGGTAQFFVPLTITANLTVTGVITASGNSSSKNFPQGKALSQDPTSAFISTIFDADAVSDSSYRMKILRSGLAYDRFNAAYSPVIAFKASDTHGFISIGYSAGAPQCYIGGGNADKINWSGKLFHDNMDLIPKDDGTFYLGYSDKRWRTLNVVNVSADGIYGYVPEGGTYQRYRLISSDDTMYLQVGAQDGTARTGKLTISGINVAVLLSLTIYSQQTLFSGAVQVNGTSRFVSLATFDAGLKIGDATLTWDASAGMLKIDKGVYSIGAITAGGKGQSNKYRLDNWTEWDASDNKWQESSLSAKLGVDLHTRLLAIEESTNIGPVKIDLEYIRNTTTLTPSQALAAGLTEDVINNMLAGRYTKVIPDNDAKEVWDYTADGSGNSISIYLTNGDGFTLKSGIVIHRNSITDNWSVTYDEI